MNGTDADIKKLIDDDEGLRSKRKMLTVVSLILLAKLFSGAEVVEANTFILKLAFKHQEGIAVLLMLATIFLLIRYYNYAKPYHRMLYKLWTKRLLNEDFHYYRCPHSDGESGVVYSLRPNSIDHEQLEYDKNSYWDYEYICRFPLRRYITFHWSGIHGEEVEQISIRKNLGFVKYFQSLALEYKHRILRFFIFRENLDILAPYMLGVLSIVSFFFVEELGIFLSYIQSIKGNY